MGGDGPECVGFWFNRFSDFVQKDIFNVIDILHTRAAFWFVGSHEA